jgi:APA family basic amino acid/polyamine antiporter
MQDRFARTLKTREVIALAFGAMIGWSWVALSGYWVQTAGSVGVLIAFAVGGLVIAVIGLTYSELASALPKAGGEHVYTHRGLGPTWSFVCTWSLLGAYLFICLFESAALATAIEYLLPQIRLGSLWQVQGADVDIGFVIVGVAGASIMTYVNVRGIATAAAFQTVVTGGIIVAGLLLIAGAVGFGSLQDAEPLFATPPVGGVLIVLILVPGLLMGFDVIPQSAEEIDLPPNRIGKLLVISVFLAVGWYVVIAFAVAISLEPGETAATTMAAGDAATSLWGSPWAGTVLVLGGVGGILTSWNAFIIGASRVIFALSDSGMLPSVFGRIHAEHKTPHVAVLAIGLLSCLSPLFGRTVLLWLANASSFAVVIAYMFVPIAFLALRRNEPDLPRPFRVSHPRLVGYSAILLAVAFLSVSLPWSPAALGWPHEWGMLGAWALFGAMVFGTADIGGH